MPDWHSPEDQLVPRAVFAKLLRAFAPYNDEIVLIGGWVHALYLADANASDTPIKTDDIDFTIPRALLAGDRPTLIELATRSDFELAAFAVGRDDVPVMLSHSGPGMQTIELDLLTDAESPTELVRIAGQPDLTLQGYPGQSLLQDNTTELQVGPEVHPSLTPPVAVRVPTLPAYVLHKGLSALERRFDEKRAKDVVYLFEIVRHPRLGAAAQAGMPALRERYPEHFARWQHYLDGLTARDPTVRDAVDQLLESGRAVGSREAVAAQVVGRLRRFAGEAGVHRPPTA